MSRDNPINQSQKGKIFKQLNHLKNMETITLPKDQFERMKREIEVLKNSRLYKRLLEFEENISKGKKFTRDDLGF